MSRLSVVLTSLPGNGADLAHRVGIDELAEIQEANVVQETKVELSEGQGAEVEAVEETEALELQERGELLELEEGLDVEDVGIEEAAEAIEAEVVDLAEQQQLVQVKGVDAEQVGEVVVGEVQAIEQRQVEAAEASVDGSETPLLGLGGSSSNSGGESRDKQADGLHFDCGCWNGRN